MSSVERCGDRLPPESAVRLPRHNRKRWHPSRDPGAFRYNLEPDSKAGSIDIAGQRFAECVRDVQRTGVAALVVDDVMPSWRRRAVEVRGRASVVQTGGKNIHEEFDDQVICIRPTEIDPWGLDPDVHQVVQQPLMQRLMAPFTNERMGIALVAGLVGWGASYILTTNVFPDWESSWPDVILTIWAWPVGAYVLATLWQLLRIEPAGLRNWLEEKDKKRILRGHVMRLRAITVFGAVTTLITIVGLQSENASYYTMTAAICAAITSWFAIHTLHAEYYAYKYCGREANSVFYFPEDAGQTGVHGYLDFAYFALAIGSTFGTTDVQILGDVMRRSVLLHEILSFWFNVGIIAVVFSLATS
jgi:uncharacterized membrane protein